MGPMPPPPAFGQPPTSLASGLPPPDEDDGVTFLDKAYMERQTVNMQAHLDCLEAIMRQYNTEDAPAPSCLICEKQGCSKANNFWDASSHIQSNRHLKNMPTWVPKGVAVNPFWQMFFHEGHKVYFSHVTLELKVL